MSETNMMHTICLLCGKEAVSIPFGVNIPYTNYSYCEDCLRKGLVLLKHKYNMAHWYEYNTQKSDKCRVIGCSKCGRSVVVNSTISFEDWIFDKNYCEHCGSYMKGEPKGNILSKWLFAFRYWKWRLLHERKRRKKIANAFKERNKENGKL